MDNAKASPSDDKTVCGVCGGGVKTQKEHPGKGLDWYCSRCVQIARDR